LGQIDEKRLSGQDIVNTFWDINKNLKMDMFRLIECKKRWNTIKNPD